MATLEWDKVGERFYETGVDHGVLYIPDSAGNYVNGYAWNGLVSVTEAPSGAEANAQYADNIQYLNLVAAEKFGGTIEAFTYPDEFGQCDGTASPTPGIKVGQQGRRQFGFSYRTLVGNDIDGTDLGYKLHLVWSALAAPSEKAYNTVNESPEAITFSWEFSTTPIPVTGLKPTATITIDSTKVQAAALASLEAILYGTAGTEPRLPSPSEVIAMFSGTVLTATPVQPNYDAGTKTITIPTTTGVDYKIDGVIVAAGARVITKDTVVKAFPKVGYKFPPVVDDDWLYKFA